MLTARDYHLILHRRRKTAPPAPGPVLRGCTDSECATRSAFSGEEQLHETVLTPAKNREIAAAPDRAVPVERVPDNQELGTGPPTAIIRCRFETVRSGYRRVVQMES